LCFFPVNVLVGLILHPGQFSPLSPGKIAIRLHPVFSSSYARLLPFQPVCFSRFQLARLNSLLNTLLLLEFPLLNPRIVNICAVAGSPVKVSKPRSSQSLKD